MSKRLHAGRLRTRVLECGCRAQPEVGGETEGRRPSFRRGASRKASSAREARVGFVRAPFKRQPSDARAHCTGTHRDDGGSVNVRGIRDATQTRIRVLFGTRALEPSVASTRRRVARASQRKRTARSNSRLGPPDSRDVSAPTSLRPARRRVLTASLTYPTTFRTHSTRSSVTAARERARTATSTTMGTTRLGRDNLRDAAAERRRQRHR